MATAAEVQSFSNQNNAMEIIEGHESQVLRNLKEGKTYVY